MQYRRCFRRTWANARNSNQCDVGCLKADAPLFLRECRDSFRWFFEGKCRLPRFRTCRFAASYQPPRGSMLQPSLRHRCIRGRISTVTAGFQASLLSSVADRPWLDLHVISVRPNYAEDNLAQYESLATFHFLDLDGPSTIPKRLKALARLAAVLRKLRPDILHVHGGIGWLPSILPGPKPCVLQVHDPPQTGRDSVLTSWVERWASRLRKWHLVVDSSGVADQLAG